MLYRSCIQVMRLLSRYEHLTTDQKHVATLRKSRERSLRVINSTEIKIITPVYKINQSNNQATLAHRII